MWMEPNRYCQTAIDGLRDAETSIESQQKIVVLAYFAEVGPSEEGFAIDLRLLADGAERDGRRSLAAAARAVLEDWSTARAGRAMVNPA
jgi:hypothetical protein